jgi:chromosome partitioning protein
MKVLAVMNQKGGSGKSTLALHLATEAVAHGQKVLLLDLDPQGNLLGWADRRGDNPPDVDATHPTKIARQIAAAKAEGYNLVVLDTAPSADRTSALAAEAADLILSPTRAAQFDLDAIRATISAAAVIKRQMVVVINAAPIRSKVVDEAIAVVTKAGATVSSAIVHQRVAFQHCLTDGRTAAEYEPGGAAAEEITALYDDMVARMNGKVSTRKSGNVSTHKSVGR